MHSMLQYKSNMMAYRELGCVENVPPPITKQTGKLEEIIKSQQN